MKGQKQKSKKLALRFDLETTPKGHAQLPIMLKYFSDYEQSLHYIRENGKTYTPLIAALEPDGLGPLVNVQVFLTFIFRSFFFYFLFLCFCFLYFYIILFMIFLFKKCF
jgi:hypothetical protein